jgi:hypothetical protein
MITSCDIPANMVEHLGLSLDLFEAFRVFERMTHARLDKMLDWLSDLIEREELLSPVGHHALTLRKNAGDYRVHKPVRALARRSALSELPPRPVMIALIF